MHYCLLEIVLEDAPKRLSRSLWARQDIDLFTLGVAIGTAFHATFEHCFLFNSRGTTFVQEAFEDLDENWKYMTNYHLKDLSREFEFSMIQARIMSSLANSLRRKIYVIEL